MVLGAEQLQNSKMKTACSTAHAVQLTKNSKTPEGKFRSYCFQKLVFLA